MARWLDKAFFALLGGLCLYLWCGDLALSGLLLLALLLVFLLWDRRRWAKYSRDLWQRTSQTLKREAWLRQEAERIRHAGGMILYPTPDAETLVGLCLRLGQGTSFHCFGEAGKDFAAQAEALGCTLTVHPWQEGTEPNREQVVERLKRDIPKRDRKLWRELLHLPGSRYLLTGCGLLLLSMILRRGLYWRLLGSLCVFIGAISRAFHVPEQT